jgi:hypothetical protein
LNITKQCNRINKDTFDEIMCLKSWGIFKEDTNEEEATDGNQDIESTFVIGDN